MELKRILIVEDDADIAAIERDYLELGGYAVTIAPGWNHRTGCRLASAV